MEKWPVLYALFYRAQIIEIITVGSFFSVFLFLSLHQRSAQTVAWSHNVTFVLFLVWSEKTGKEQRFLNNLQGDGSHGAPPEVGARLWLAQVIFST